MQLAFGFDLMIQQNEVSLESAVDDVLWKKMAGVVVLGCGEKTEEEQKQVEGVNWGEKSHGAPLQGQLMLFLALAANDLYKTAI